MRRDNLAKKRALTVAELHNALKFNDCRSTNGHLLY